MIFDITHFLFYGGPMFVEFTFNLLFLTACALFIYALALKFPRPVVSFPTRPSRAIPTRFRRFMRLPVVIAINTFSILTFMAYALLWVYRRTSAAVLQGVFVLCLTTVIWYVLYLSTQSFTSTARTKKILSSLLPLAAIAISILWIIMPIWIVYDLVAIFAGYCVLIAIPQAGIGKLAGSLTGVILYDLWGVYGNGGSGGDGGVIVQLVKSMSFMPPTVIQVPDIWNLWDPTKIGLVLGLGDILLPGLAVMAAAKYGKTDQLVFSYIAGLAGALFVQARLDAPLPATVILVPVTLIPLLFYARRRSRQTV